MEETVGAKLEGVTTYVSNVRIFKVVKTHETVVNLVNSKGWFGGVFLRQILGSQNLGKVDEVDSIVETFL